MAPPRTSEAALGYRLIDRYVHDHGRVFMSGSQALARLPFEQLRADRAAGLNTAAFVSGYPGSPLAAFDRDAAAAGRLATEAGYTMVVQPGLNEELAATSVMGSQLATTLDSCRYDGIIGIWFGKAPGLDRASDAIRHAVFAGASAKGGAVALVGDDPKAKSSTLPSSSDATLVDLDMPVLYPGDVQEAIDLGRHAIALSRASGLWTSIKVVDAVADGTGTVDITLDRVRPVMTQFEVNGTLFVPRPSGKLLTPYTLDMEREFQEVRLEIARIYGAENNLNHVTVRGPSDWIGLVATGHTHHEMVEALRLLGFGSDDDLRNAGIRILKLGLPIPHDPRIVREFASGLTEVMVIEEKSPTLELMVKDALYSLNERPVVTGKQHPDGTALLPRTGTLDADTIAPRLRARLGQRLSQRMTPPPPAPKQMIPLSVNRSPFFCSGCPHNTSTKVADGELIGAGIGCHSMVMLMEPERVGNIVGLTAMGNEGAQWIGMAPFVAETHLTQNIGDGTLFHSGILAVRAAAASGVNITYKILYNDAVAMTGGQHPYGQLDVPHLVRALLAEGVSQVMITTDDLRRYDDIPLPDGVKVWGRQRLVEAQQLLATQPGCTVLIHDQRCAAEQRRDRKRGRIERPPFKVLINERVCEGCGDCGDISNCLSVQPVDTPFGRKTRIDQSSCNFDLSCMEGDCPSFAEVAPAKRSKRSNGSTQSAADATTGSTARQPPSVPAAPVVATPHTVRMSGIGGTGVVTISQILGTAAMIDGLHVRGLDQTGLSQKAGTVVSDLRITTAQPQPSNKATAGSVDLLLAFDQLAASSDAQLVGAAAQRTHAVVNSARVPTGSMVVHPEQPFPTAEIDQRLAEFTASRRDVDATGLTTALLGDDAGANVFLLGVACQIGELPVTAAAVEQAIELNGVAVAKNLAAFAWGRAWAHDPPVVDDAAGVRRALPVDDKPLVQRLAADLQDYQSARYATRFTRVVDQVAAAGHPELTDAVARHLHKLMAYKDEYEVARLLLLPESQVAAEAVAGPGATVRWRLHPPIMRTLGMHRKITLGRWARPIMTTLRAMRGLRGTPLDVFGWAKVRRVEQAMIPEYIAAIEAMLPHVTAANLADAVAVASLPDSVRGYEHLKMERAGIYRAELSRRVQAFCGRTLPAAN